MLEKKIRAEQYPARRWNDLARLYQKTADYDHAAEAKSRSLDAHLNEVFEGDHRHRIAGPDSGFLNRNSYAVMKPIPKRPRKRRSPGAAPQFPVNLPSGMVRTRSTASHSFQGEIRDAAEQEPPPPAPSSDKPGPQARAAAADGRKAHAEKNDTPSCGRHAPGSGHTRSGRSPS